MSKDLLISNKTISIVLFIANSNIEKGEELEQLNRILVELKAQIQIENRKKLLIKDKLDQAFLRGASAICIEALTMSQSNMAGTTLLLTIEYLKEEPLKQRIGVTEVKSQQYTIKK